MILKRLSLWQHICQVHEIVDEFARVCLAIRVAHCGRLKDAIYPSADLTLNACTTRATRSRQESAPLDGIPRLEHYAHHPHEPPEERILQVTQPQPATRTDNRWVGLHAARPSGSHRAMARVLLNRGSTEAADIGRRRQNRKSQNRNFN
jgi:hypothetical protein